MEKFYTCKYDRAFKEIFMKEENKDILSKVLETILKIEVKEIRFLNLERNVDNVKIKRKHLDLYLETNIGKIQVEVNSGESKYVRPRNMSYLCDIYSHHTQKGKEYEEEVLIIQINFSYGLKYKEYIRKNMVQDENKNKYVKNFIIYELNMEKYMKIWYNKNEKEIEENKYLLMLNLEIKDLEKLSEDKVVSKYMSEIERVNENPEFREYMSAEEDNRKIENSLRREWKEEGIAEGLAEGREKGIKEGIKEGSNNRNLEIAKLMLEKGLNISLISEITNLSKEELNQLNK